MVVAVHLSRINIISSTYIAVLVSFLTIGLPVLGFEVADEGTLTQTATGIIGVLALLYAFYGRYKAGGINAFGIRKKEELG